MSQVQLRDRVRELRLSKGMSQEDLAKLLDVDKVAVSQWERGVRQPRDEYKEALCDIFNVNMDYLMGRTNYTTKIIHGAELSSFDFSSRPNLHRLMDYFATMSESQLQSVITLLRIGEDDN